MKCRVCDTQTINFFSLGNMPLVNSFLTKAQLSQEKRYDLSLCFCPKCYLVQLKKTVPPEELFRNYIYFSSTSSKFLEHCKDTADYLTERLKLNSTSLVLEIASNDGAQLQYFKQLGIRVLGIDPAKNIADVANAKGIRTVPEFFNLPLAQKLSSQQKIKADLVFGANVLAHVPQIVDFVRGIKIILKRHGTAVFEFPYLQGLFKNKFDTIYHEHVFYYSLLSVQNLFQHAGLTIYDADMTDMQGGSLRIFASLPNAFTVNKHVTAIIAKERKLGFDNIDAYRKIKTHVEQLRMDVLETLTGLKNKGKTIAAYSAPAKGNILLNYFGIDSNILSFIVDKSKVKQGLYTPGTHFMVYPPEKIYQKKPDYLLILCWNIADEVIQTHQQYRNSGGKFIIPVPRLSVV